MNENVALSARGLSRYFGKERFPAVEELSFDLAYGQVHAMLGPNGAGKTTTVRMCATLLTPSAGGLTIGGYDAVRQPRQARHEIGLVLGGELGFYPRATARDNLRFFADVADVPFHARDERISWALDRVELSQWAGKKVGQFSRGMTQRLHIARALLNRPKLLLLDEPTAGLDPEVALNIRDLIATLADDGAAVLLTSHSMSEIEELASVVTVIGAGHLVVHGSIQDVERFAGVSVTTTATLRADAITARDRLQDRLAGRGVVEMRPKGSAWGLTVYWSEPYRDGEAMLRKALAGLGVPVPDDLLTRRAGLEDAYLAIADRLQR